MSTSLESLKAAFLSPAVSSVAPLTNPDTPPATSTYPQVSIVVPTRNEAANIAELVRRLDGMAAIASKEIIFVDDSTDDTPATIGALKEAGHDSIVLVHRSPEQRGDGLGGAVLRGLQLARAPWVCVMDADLQHPPEIVPRLLAEAEQTGGDLVIASRYRDEGEASDFGLVRAFVSRGSTTVAKLAFPRRLRGVTDPMSGFFLVRKDAIDVARLRPRGFKILLEIIGRTPGLRIAEVPFRFGTRFAGESKASLREGLRYARLLLHLRCGDTAARFGLFGLVGASGLVVNTLVLALATEILGLYYLLSAVIATQGSTAWNFGLSELWVFSRRSQRFRRLQRCAMFYLMNNAALALRGPMIYVLTATLSVNYLLANLISLVALMVLRYATSDRWIWGVAPTTPTPASSSVPAPIAAAPTTLLNKGA